MCTGTQESPPCFPNCLPVRLHKDGAFDAACARPVKLRLV
jgi:hypothetical protein